MQLYLIRHPAPQIAAGVCYGRSDLPLAEDVAVAAARILPQLPPLLPPLLPLYTSPLQRCLQLANALHPAPHSDHRLQEMNFGVWELRPWQLIEREALDGWAADPLGYCPPQGESVGQLQARVHDFVMEARRQGVQRAVLVTHAGVMKVIVGHARGLPATQWMALKFEHESVIEVDMPNPETSHQGIPSSPKGTRT
ncbi:MAG: alpha-ribazole phosphatase family protein [Sulfuritalea sp.]|nr:alpha-ribazole phosphatase family protein [Sulfuritalea sp.]